MKKIFAISLISLFAMSAMADNKSETLVVSTTPQMSCAGCENKIKKNIRFVKGTKKIETSVPNQTVTITYDSQKCKYEDYVAAFKKIGYNIKKAEKK